MSSQLLIHSENSSNQDGYDYLAGLTPLGIPFPKFTQEELILEQARYRMALENKSPFFLPLEKAGTQTGQIPFPLKSMPLYIPEEHYRKYLGELLGEHDFIEPFLFLLNEHKDRIPSRRFPKDFPVSALDAHYLPVSVAGAMLSRYNLRNGSVGESQHYSTRFNAILGLFHDGPEDEVFTKEEIKQISSKDTNGHLAAAVEVLTRNGTHNNPDILQKNTIYQAYGKRIGEDPNLAFMKWIDITASCLSDLLNGVERSKSDRYIEKQSIVLQAMGGVLLQRAGKLLSIPQYVDA